MKSLAELRTVLRRQWDDATKRESRLLGGADAWPIEVPIGRPKPQVVASDLDAVKRHVDEWRCVDIGEVIWGPINYRATASPVDMPLTWRLRQPTEWIAACADRAMREEFESLSVFVEKMDACFHSLLICRRSLWRDRAVDDVLQAGRLAMALTPGYADGKSLRMMACEGIDTKFIEQHSRLVTTLLDARFDGEVSRIGLEAFLDAATDGDHWLLVIDLDGSLLPFQKQRVRSSELKNISLPGSRLLIVENETCQHQLPNLSETIAVLGAGNDLGWTQGSSLQAKRVGYWGDIDTWGLKLLAGARQTLPHLDALMMTAKVYQRHLDAAVEEKIVAGADAPAGLTTVERSLYERLLSEPRGRLEQEFLFEACVHAALHNWCAI